MNKKSSDRHGAMDIPRIQNRVTGSPGHTVIPDLSSVAGRDACARKKKRQTSQITRTDQDRAMSRSLFVCFEGVGRRQDKDR
jgi:hypothetical protein